MLSGNPSLIDSSFPSPATDRCLTIGTNTFHTEFGMITIGLVGGVACGKSLVASHFQKLGACVLNGDRIGHEVLQRPEIEKALLKRWGSRVSSQDGHLDRKAISTIVFGAAKSAEAELKFLESLTHPEIGRTLKERIVQLKELGRVPVIVVDAAVMLKAGWNKLCDQIVLVDAPIELREKRAVTRGLTVEQFRARELAQLPIEEKRKVADIVIDNSGPPSKTYQQIEQVWHSLQQIT